MLNRAKVLQQLQHIEQHMFTDLTPLLHEAHQLWDTIAHDSLFKAQVIAASLELGLPLWYTELSSIYTIEKNKESYTLGAVDGSQIFPDRHAGSPCFLINIGTVLIRYGKQGYAKLDSQPYVFTGNETEREGIFWGGTTPDTISAHRHMLELRYGLRLMHVQRVDDIPSLLLFDGSLLFWHLASKSIETQHYFAAQYMTVLEELYQQSCLVACYISLPHSKELVSLVRFARAGGSLTLFKEKSDADILLDKHIVQFYVPVGARTDIFKSNVALATLYPEHLRPHFFYIRGEKEIVRIEIPAWIAHHKEKVDKIAALVTDQMQKGNGYPVALAEAHEQAVVKGQDREFFYQLVQKISIAQRRTLIPSQKSIKKRSICI